MKIKLLKLVMLSFSVLLLVSCGGDKKSEPVNTENPSAIEEQEQEPPKLVKHSIVETEEAIMNLVVEQKYQEAVDLMLKDGDMTGLDVSQVKQAAPFFGQMVKSTFNKNGGLSGFDIENPEVDADAKRIDLVVNLKFADGKTQTQKVRYNLVNDKWKREIVTDNKKR